MRAPLLLLLTLCGCYPKGWIASQAAYIQNPPPFTLGPYLVKTGPRSLAVVVDHAELESAPTLVFNATLSG
ncbi:MAG: hypothetical protein KC492_38565, partial [Myxococcales bacterium]|nr:hypothetical protein [Myxococcales bacterium]